MSAAPFCANLELYSEVFVNYKYLFAFFQRGADLSRKIHSIHSGKSTKRWRRSELFPPAPLDVPLGGADEPETFISEPQQLKTRRVKHNHPSAEAADASIIQNPPMNNSTAPNPLSVLTHSLGESSPLCERVNAVTRSPERSSASKDS